MTLARRQFLGRVGNGMLLAGLGTSLAMDIGVEDARAGESEIPLSFGDLEPLVSLMQETPPAELTALLVALVVVGPSGQRSRRVNCMLHHMHYAGLRCI